MNMNLFRQWKLIVVPVIFLAAVVLRIAFLDADPPSTVDLQFISDEGWWVHNARNKILFGTWVLDDFNQSLLASPPFCIATYSVYSLFGVGYGTSRIIPVICGLLTLLLFSGILHAHLPSKNAALATLLFGCNFAYTSMNRTAYVESTALMFLILSWWLIDRLSHRVWAVFLAGMSFALSVLTKSYMASVLVPVGAIILLRWFTDKRKIKWASALLNGFLFVGGVFAIYMLWRKYFFIPFHDDYQLMYSLWQDGNFPKTIGEALRNIPSFFIGRHGFYLIPARFFGLNATLLILAGYRIHRLISSEPGSLKAIWKNMPVIDRECLVFLLVLSLQIAPLTAKPFRRYLLFYIPLIILASRSVSDRQNDSSTRKVTHHLRIVQLLVPLIVTGILIPPFLVRWFPLPLPEAVTYFTAVILVAICTCLLIRAFKFFDFSFTVKISTALLLFFIIDGGFFFHAFLTKSYTLRDTSRRLGDTYFTVGSGVLGGISNSLSLENQARAIAIWGREEAPRVLNQDPIRRFAPDYVIVLRKLDGMDWVKEYRYERYVHPENFLETIYLLPIKDGFRVEAELYRAPKSEIHTKPGIFLNI